VRYFLEPYCKNHPALEAPPPGPLGLQRLGSLPPDPKLLLTYTVTVSLACDPFILSEYGIQLYRRKLLYKSNTHSKRFAFASYTL